MGNLRERDHWEDPDVDGRPEETTICYKISLVQLITNLNVILYLSTLIINAYVSLIYELKKNGKTFTSKFVGTGPSSYKK